MHLVEAVLLQGTYFQRLLQLRSLCSAAQVDPQAGCAVWVQTHGCGNRWGGGGGHMAQLSGYSSGQQLPPGPLDRAAPTPACRLQEGDEGSSLCAPADMPDEAELDYDERAAMVRPRKLCRLQGAALLRTKQQHTSNHSSSTGSSAAMYRKPTITSDQGGHPWGARC